MGLFDFIGDIFGGNDKEQSTTTTRDWRRLPGYAESDQARQTWWDTLQKWGTQPGYGAVSPDFNAIWENARSRVQRYFGGGPDGPGADAMVRAGAARRGVSDQAATDTLMQRSRFKHGNMLQDLAVKQAIEEANLGEKGRQTWLGSMQDLAGLKPTYADFGGTTTTESNGNIMSSEGTSGALNKVLSMFGLGEPTTGNYMDTTDQRSRAPEDYYLNPAGGQDTGIGDVNQDGGGFDVKKILPQIIPYLVQLFA